MSDRSPTARDPLGRPLERPAPPPGDPWDAPFEAAPMVWLDLEMTGLDPEADRICEIAALRVRGGEVERKLVSLVRPGVPVGRSEEVHGIDDATLADAPPLETLRAPLAALLEGAVLVGHAIRYDLSFLLAAADRGELAPPPRNALDTRRLARRCWHRGSYSLASLTAEHALVDPTHRAESDAIACGQLLDVLRKELRAATPRHLLQAQDRETPIRFRDDVAEALRVGLESGRPVRLAYRAPSRDPFVDRLEVRALDESHVDGRLLDKGLVKTLRGDRVLWAELA